MSQTSYQAALPHDIVKECVKYISWGGFCQALVAGAGIGATGHVSSARVLFNAVVSDVEVLFDSVLVTPSSLNSEFREREVNIAELNASFNTGIHVVGAASGVDGDLDVFEVGGGRIAIGLSAVATLVALSAASFSFICAELDGEGGGGLTIGESEDEEESIGVALGI